MLCGTSPAATVKVRLIDEDEEVEAATFMPRAFRSSDDDSALRKWRAGDVVTRAVDAQIGGGAFGEGQKNKCFVPHVRTVAAAYFLDNIDG